MLSPYCQNRFTNILHQNRSSHDAFTHTQHNRFALLCPRLFIALLIVLTLFFLITQTSFSSQTPGGLTNRANPTSTNTLCCNLCRFRLVLFLLMPHSFIVLSFFTDASHLRLTHVFVHFCSLPQICCLMLSSMFSLQIF